MKTISYTGLQKNSRSQENAWDEFWKKRSFSAKLLMIGRKAGAFLHYHCILKNYSDGNIFCELGCGSGILLTKIAKRAETVVGIDYSEAALETARDFSKKEKIDNFSLLKDDCQKLKTKIKCDIVYSQGLVEHFDDPAKIISEHLKITKKNGYTIISVPSKISFKYLWYLVSRIKGLRKLWPWPDQMFFTSKSLGEIFRNNFLEYKKYQVKTFLPTEDIILIIKKN